MIDIVWRSFVILEIDVIRFSGGGGGGGGYRHCHRHPFGHLLQDSSESIPWHTLFRQEDRFDAKLREPEIQRNPYQPRFERQQD